MAETRNGRPNVDVRDDKSIGELVADVGRDLSELVRKEMELAKVEIKTEVREAGKAGGMFGAAALTGYLALLLASFAAAWGLAEIIPAGFAFLAVSVVYAIAAAVLYSRGRQEMKQVSPVPKQTVETVKEDVAWAREQMS